MSDPRLVVISGPSGCGKSTLVRRLVEDARVRLSVSATTRAPRSGEVAGRDYHFLERAEFEALRDRGGFLEWAEVHGELYGTPRSEVAADPARPAEVVLLDIDVQGFRIVRASGHPALSIFIVAPSMAELRARLEGRGTETRERIETRLVNAAREMEARDEYDHVVVNGDVNDALQTLRRHLGLAPREASECDATTGKTPR